MNEPAAQMWLQYTHLDKLYGYLPGIPEALPAVFGLTPAEYADITAQFDAHARNAAVELLADHSFTADVDALPFQPNQTVLAVGDSVTDDAQSWVEILRHALHIRRPTDGLHIVNGGLSAHTTAMVLRRWPATLAATRPDWIICALGSNDVTRIGPEPTKPQVSPAENVANLAELRRIAEFPAFRYGQSIWHNTDILVLANALHEFTDPVVDLVAAFGTPADPQLHGADGLHPTIDGQSTITRALAGHLSTIGSTASP